MKYDDASVLFHLENSIINISESEYLEPENIEYLDFKEHDLNVLHLNICSLHGKKDKFELLLAILSEKGYHTDVVTVCETHITNDNKNLCENYNFEHKYRKNKTG